MTDQTSMRVGVSQEFTCSYLPDRQEQVLLILEPHYYNPDKYEQLLASGFRRSGDQIYRPHCPSCNACKSIRVLANKFIPSKSQKRKVNKTKKQFTLRYSNVEKPQYYSLYSKYISERHDDGAMFPPNLEQYKSFLLCNWLEIIFIELWDNDKLIAVAVTDCMNNAVSAIYTFFDPDYAHFSLGSVMIIAQIEFAKKHQKQFLYLGYQIDECTKMKYKTQFLPAQKYDNNAWLTI
ncbi:arginyltransferase [Pseudoalteromonas sp. MMG010]|uniref:arginyltransferase n=1 Tax=Pseudoalteromonas sp. MMG010 TaxID=2822685 RepID=UPI001B3A1B64|nr:arginyltransferase [Pseudoalteromonas sp. MMG010]MBQ4832504.1 arginyltransferase [Pseudoalteromonas sp. MMG010]